MDQLPQGKVQFNEKILNVSSQNKLRLHTYSTMHIIIIFCLAHIEKIIIQRLEVNVIHVILHYIPMKHKKDLMVLPLQKKS
uniref:Uncharacterized protein n=1 Tax=Anguilla anguilla TaxID=7936 RepID=A0A0E9W6V1_ANGAN